jgi:hypothetical protein
MRALTRMAFALPMVVALAAPATAQTTYVPVYNTEATYVHCGADKATVNEHVTYNWNTTAPTTSFTANGGCGSLDAHSQDGDGVTYTGKHTGNLDRLTVHAWVIDCCLTHAGVFSEVYTNVSVLIDGNEVVSSQEAHIVPIPSETNISRLLEFSVTGIGLKTEADNKEHEVTVNLETSSILDGDAVAWVLDATEVKSGVTFSPTTLAAHRIAAGS